ncbi:Lrp/AsnC family transcriptional regulator [Fodinicola acaciae]|uniref:Lrp/AsnC family transcriptional regulator n=1 Tax=Fodinicola acaciae TaxID=2681555 RepID=UPI0013D774A0|nr:AsnC family transcriptional regulator [Fodinicola acaciae]
METVTLDEIDRGLVHALQIDGRAAFVRIAEVLGVSENTVARRYRRLRAAGVLKVVGTVAGPLLGYASWTIRLRCAPDSAGAIAAALARRADTYWVHLLSGGTEISCNTQARTPAERDALLLDKLPRTSRIVAITAHSILEGYATPMTWRGAHCLSGSQIARLQPDLPRPRGRRFTAADQVLADALAKDGRLSYPELARATGWSPSTVKRRMDELRADGLLAYAVDIAPAALGFQVEARLWMSVPPSHIRSVGQELARHKEISFAALTTGPTNLVASVICRDSAHLSAYLTDRLGTIEAIRHLESAPVIRTLKGAA